MWLIREDPNYAEAQRKQSAFRNSGKGRGHWLKTNRHMAKIIGTKGGSISKRRSKPQEAQGAYRAGA